MWQSIIPIVWPLLVLIFFAVFFFEIKSLFRAMVSLCNNAESFEFAGFKLKSSSPLSLGEQNVSDARYLEMLKAFQSPTITNEEITIRKQLSAAKCTTQQANDVLITQLANRILLTQLFYIDRFIFNAQISLLLYLNNQGKPCLASELNKFYVEYQNDFRLHKVPNAIESTEDQFLAFLITNGLIAQNMSGYFITPLGKDYLGFVVRVGRPLPQIPAGSVPQKKN